jgi:hypothetical protein
MQQSNGPLHLDYIADDQRQLAATQSTVTEWCRTLQEVQCLAEVEGERLEELVMFTGTGASGQH